MKEPPPIFDDEYSGPRYRYGLQYRPAAGAGIPKGYIVFSDRKHPAFQFGTIDYPTPLTDAHAKQVDLVFVPV